MRRLLIAGARRRLAGALLAACLLPGLVLPAVGADQKTDEDRLCLWLLWCARPELARQAQAALEKGRPFTIVARQLARAHPQQVRVGADCLPASRLDPQVRRRVRPLRLGQVDGPFPLAGGQALVMRTTDRYRRRGQELFSRGMYAQAEAELKKDLRLHPTAAPTWHLIALSRSARGDHAGALKALAQALKWDPDNPAILSDQAAALASLGRRKEALPIFERALRLAPDNPLIMANLAWDLLLLRRDLARAERLAARAVRLDPKSAPAWSTLGQIQKARGKPAQARHSLRRALELDPSLSEARRALDELARARPTEKRVHTAPGQKPPPPATKPSPPPAKHVATPAPGYYLQVATYRQVRLARRELANWRRLGVRARLEAWRDGKGRTWQRVLLGPFPSAEAAASRGRGLEARGWIRAFRVVRRPANRGRRQP